jgi:dynactin complex subunit
MLDDSDDAEGHASLIANLREENKRLRQVLAERDKTIERLRTQIAVLHHREFNRRRR